MGGPHGGRARKKAKSEGENLGTKIPFGIFVLFFVRFLFTDTAFMPPEYYPELVAAGVEDRVMFGTDLPLQAGFYKGSIDELYANDLEGAREYGYSEAVMSGNFFRFLGTTP